MLVYQRVWPLILTMAMLRRSQQAMPIAGNVAGPSRDQQRLLREHGAHRQLQMFLGKGIPDMNWAVAARKPQLVDDYTTGLWL